jgi:signal transduction histidine kinase
MERVFGNLLSNAIKYASRAPDIYVRGWMDQATIHVSVRDTGIGIDPEDLSRLFEPYFRAQSAAGIAGTGIGLNIVREIVELHGGKISIESEVGQGSTFTVSLPRNDPDHGARQAA